MYVYRAFQVDCHAMQTSGDGFLFLFFYVFLMNNSLKLNVCQKKRVTVVALIRFSCYFIFQDS